MYAMVGGWTDGADGPTGTDSLNCSLSMVWLLVAGIGGQKSGVVRAMAITTSQWPTSIAPIKELQANASRRLFLFLTWLINAVSPINKTN